MPGCVSQTVALFLGDHVENSNMWPGTINQQRLLVILTVILGIAVCIGAASIELRPALLTWQHGSEMRLAIQRYNELFASLDGQSDPAVMASFATGEYLDYLMKVRCTNCPSIQVAREVNVVDLKVLDYSPTSSRVYARIEYGWNEVSPETGDVMGPCHAQAFSAIYLLVWQDNAWKITDGEDINANRLDDTVELLTKYCDGT